MEKLSNWLKDTQLIHDEPEFKLSPEFALLIFTLLPQVNPIKMTGKTF